MKKKYKFEVYDNSYLDGRDYFSIGFVEVSHWKYVTQGWRGNTVRKTKLK